MSLRGLLLATVLVLLGLLGVEVAGLRYWLHQHAPDAAPPASAEAKPVIEPLLREQLGRVGAMPQPATPSHLLERPLFTPARRPPAPEASDPEPEAVAEEKPPPELEITLRSIVLAPGSARAWVQPEGEDDLVRLREGDTFDGWTLTSIARDEVVFTSEEHSRNVSLRPQRSRQLEFERVMPQPTAPPLP